MILLLVQTNFNLSLDININNQPSTFTSTSKSNLSYQRSTISSNNQRPPEFYVNQFETCGHLNKDLIIGTISCVRIIHGLFDTKSTDSKSCLLKCYIQEGNICLVYSETNVWHYIKLTEWAGF